MYVAHPRVLPPCPIPPFSHLKYAPPPPSPFLQLRQLLREAAFPLFLIVGVPVVAFVLVLLIERLYNRRRAAKEAADLE